MGECYQGVRWSGRSTELVCNTSAATLTCSCWGLKTGTYLNYCHRKNRLSWGKINLLPIKILGYWETNVSWGASYLFLQRPPRQSPHYKKHANTQTFHSNATDSTRSWHIWVQHKLASKADISYRGNSKKSIKASTEHKAVSYAGMLHLCSA